MRGLGVTSTVVHHVPEPLVPVLVVFTFLGSPTFMAGAAPVGAWVGYRLGGLTRRDAIRFLAVAVLAIGLSSLLKNAIALPRPPSSLWLVPEDGYGFPSGHSLVSTGVTVGFASFVERDRRLAVALALGFSALVAASRLLLGVHYLVDVLAGLAIGLLVVAAGRWLTDRHLVGTAGFGVLAGLVGLFLR